MATVAGDKRLVREAFRPWEAGDSGPFFALIAEDVRWTLIGSMVASGVYQSKQALVDPASRRGQVGGIVTSRPEEDSREAR